MRSDNELRYLLALQRTPNLGDTSAKKLLQQIGSAEGIFKEKKETLLKIDGIGAYRLEGMNANRQLEEAAEELEFIRSNNIECLYFKDKSYPFRLKQCLDAPILLFTKGNIDLESKRILSVVGTRNATAHGIEICERIISDLAPLKPVIVSGFAYGIDITAHKASIEHKLQNIACLAHGLNQWYPKTHQKYVKDIMENGGFITEFWSSDIFDRKNFLKRNRIIAGMSEATIVVESAEKGGSLVTADIANSYDREVFAVPGRPRDQLSKGCNNLIKSQQAQLIESAADVIYLLNWELPEKPKSVQTELFVSLSTEEKKIMDYLHTNGKELLDLIAINCQLPTHKVAGLLLSLELKGLIRPLPGKQFEII